jgi:hypothetical protein
MLRREGIYSSLLGAWRVQLGAHGAAGLVAKKPGRKPKLTEAERVNVALVKRNAELERKLHIANVLIALQKRRTRSLGWPCPSSTAAADGPRGGLRRARRFGCRRMHRARARARLGLPSDRASAPADFHGARSRRSARLRRPSRKRSDGRRKRCRVAARLGIRRLDGPHWLEDDSRYALPGTWP